MNHNAPRPLQTTELLHVTQHHFLHYITCLLHTSAPLLAHTVVDNHILRDGKKKTEKKNKQTTIKGNQEKSPIKYYKDKCIFK